MLKQKKYSLINTINYMNIKNRKTGREMLYLVIRLLSDAKLTNYRGSVAEKSGSKS